MWKADFPLGCWSLSDPSATCRHFLCLGQGRSKNPHVDGSFHEGSCVGVNGNCFFPFGLWCALTSPGPEADPGPSPSFALCQLFCFRAWSKDVPRKWTISNYNNDPCLTESSLIAIAQGIIVAHALNYYGVFFKSRIGFGARRVARVGRGFSVLPFAWPVHLDFILYGQTSQDIENRCRGPKLFGDSAGKRRSRKGRREDWYSRLYFCA